MDIIIPPVVRWYDGAFGNPTRWRSGRSITPAVLFPVYPRVRARSSRILGEPKPAKISGLGLRAAGIGSAERTILFTLHSLGRIDMVDKEAVREALREVYDPEIPVNIVDLGLIYEIDERDDVEDGIHVEMTLTSMGCPIADQLKRNVEVAAKSVEGVGEVSVELVWDPPWSPTDATDEGKAQLQSLGIRIPDYSDSGDEATANQAPF